MWAGNFTGGESARKWGSGQYSQMTRDRTHRPVHRVNADSVHPLGRRGQRVGSSSIPAAVGAVTSEVGSGSATSEPPTRALASLERGDQCRVLITGLQSTRAARGGLSSPAHCRPCTLVCREVPTHREERDLLNAWHLSNGATSAACWSRISRARVRGVERSRRASRCLLCHMLYRCAPDSATTT